MKKPRDIVYGVNDSPPLGVTLPTGLQHVVLISIRLLFPLLVCREAGLPPDRVLDVLSLSMIVMGLATVLQALPRGPVGSGFLCPPSFTSAYIVPSLSAARTGGMPLVAGMTLFGGLLEVGLSRVFRRLRPLFPAEIAGYVVVAVGMTLGAVGMRNILNIDAPQGASARDFAVAAASLATMVGLNVWTKGLPRLFCALLGMGVGYTASAVVGRLTGADFRSVDTAPFLHLPSLRHASWSFDLALTVPFAVAALAASLRAMGDVTTCQKTNDAEWTRPNLRSITGGMLANGMSTAAGGLLGTIGVNTLTSGVGLAAATGVTSRRVAYAIGGIFLALAFLPKAAALLAIVPQPVLGAVLLFSACFVFINGLQIITSRLLDARRIFVIGLAFMIGLAVELYPAFFKGLPRAAQPFVGSALVLGTLTALCLNLIFRLGVRRTQTVMVEPGQFDPKGVEDFMEAQGAAWGARRDIIDRARFNLTQSLETILEGCDPQGPLEVRASFDEFNLDLEVSYPGAPLELPERRPSNDEIMASEEGQRRLAGFMLRRLADRVQSRFKAGRSTVLFHFDH